MARRSLLRIAARLGATWLAVVCPGVASAEPDLQAVHPTLRSVFDASGLDEGERQFFESRFDALTVEVAARVGNVRSPERRARRLHRALHDRVFVRYQDDADGIDDVIGRGEFNCVSSTLVEGLMAAALGLPSTIVSDSRHVHLRMALPSKVVDIETTLRSGFDVGGSAAAEARFRQVDAAAAVDGFSLRGALEAPVHGRGEGREVGLADGAAFVWHNNAERALARGEGRAAAERFLAGETLYPGVATAGDGLQLELGRAFRQDYDAGRFDDAYVTAAIGVTLGPGVVSAHDRLLAVGAQRIERLLDRGEVERAEDLLVDLDQRLGANATRLERHLLPSVVAAAVRVGDWDRADCLADRFASVEIDRVEGRRLRAWVRGRRIEAEAAR